MKNLKKVLALVLAFACAFTMFAGAAFTDAADIEHSEAVDMLNSLGVIGGYPDGSFHPEKTITRAEMAKMIFTIRNGGSTNADAYKDVATTFTDIDGHWAAGYIKYCQVNGIISGKSSYIFDPEGEVTVVETAKMALVLMGYKADANRANLVGAGWESRVLSLATDNSLLDKVAGSVTAPITRDEAAQLLFNTIDADCVVWSNDVETFIKDQVTVGTEWHIWNVGTKYLGLQEWIGTYNGNYDTGDTAKEGYIDVNHADFPFELDLWENIGEEVKVLFKDGKNGIDNVPDEKDTIYGVYNTGNTTVYTTTKDAIQDVDQANSKIKFGDVKYDYVVGGSIVTNFGQVTVALTDANMAALDIQSGDQIKFVCNDDDKIANAYVLASVMTKVNAVSSTKVTLNGLGTLELDKNDIYDGIAKDDVVVYTEYYVDGDLNGDTYVVVEKAEVVSGTIESYNNANMAEQTVTIDGTTYKIEAAGLVNNLTDDAIAALATTHIDTTVNAYLVNGMVKALQETDDTVLNYAVVLSSNHTVTGGVNVGKVQILKADGTKAIYEVDEDSDIQADTLDAGDLIKYSLTGGELLDVAAGNNYTDAGNVQNIADDGTVWNYDTKTVAPGTAAAAVASSDCVLFVNTDGIGDWKAYQIRNLKTTTNTTGGAEGMSYAKDNQGKMEAAAINLQTTPNGALTSTLYGTVTARGGIVKIDDTNYAKFTIWTGEETHVYIKNGAANDLAVGQLVSFEQTVDDKYGNVGDFTTLNANGLTVIDAAVDEYSEADQTLSIFGGVVDNGVNGYDGVNSTSYAVDDDVKIVYIDAENDKAGEAVGINEFDGNTGYANVKVVINNGVVVAILVETSGKVDINGNDAVAAAYLGDVDTVADIEAALDANGSATVGNADLTGSLTIDAGQTLIVTGTLSVGAGHTLTVNGDLVVNNLDLDGGTLTGTGTVNGETIVLGSTISGTLSIVFESATIEGNMNISGSTLTIKGAITSEGAYTLTISGSSDVTVVGAVKANVTVSDDADVSVGNVTGDVSNTGTGNVTTGSVSGEVTGNVTSDKLTTEQIVKAALAYEYAPDYAYTNDPTVEGTTISYAATAEQYQDGEGDKTATATADLARLVGAIYRFNNGASVSKITYDGKDYTWNADLGLKGSNWANGDTTLVSAVGTAVTPAALASGLDIEFTINGETVTLHLSIKA